MATLAQVRTALKNTIAGAIPALYCYDRVSDLENSPACVIEPDLADFGKAMGRGTDEWIFNLFVLCEAGLDTSVGQERLDAFVSGCGDESIRQALYQNSELGLPDTDSSCFAMRGYGGTHDAAKILLVGAVLRVRVWTSGIPEGHH